MAPRRTANSADKKGGLKGFFTRASKSFMVGGTYAKDKSYWVAEKLAKVGFVIATTSFVTLMPLIFEIAREGQMIESEKIQVKQLRNDGFVDRQLQEMGFCQAAISRTPAVAMKK